MSEGWLLPSRVNESDLDADFEAVPADGHVSAPVPTRGSDVLKVVPQLSLEDPGVVGDYDASLVQLVLHQPQIVQVLVLRCVQEHQVELSLQPGQDLQGVADQHIDPRRYPHPPYVLLGCPRLVWVDLYGDNLGVAAELPAHEDRGEPDELASLRARMHDRLGCG